MNRCRDLACALQEAHERGGEIGGDYQQFRGSGRLNVLEGLRWMRLWGCGLVLMVSSEGVCSGLGGFAGKNGAQSSLFYIVVPRHGSCGRRTREYETDQRRPCGLTTIVLRWSCRPLDLHHST